jgi:shikimate dehydrogenase
MDRYAVIGNPVEHSISPRIHAWFASRTSQALEYGRILAPRDGFVVAASQFVGAGGRGLNVTVPFKTEAAAWVDELDGPARVAGAVNTVSVEGAKKIGYNTDGPGLVTDLESNCRETLRGRRILLLGAGGAAAGVLGPLVDRGPERVVVANRTPARAEALVARWPDELTRGAVAAVRFADLRPGFDVVINATSAGLENDVPPIDPAVVRGAFCYDMVYGATTAFCTWAVASGARAAVDGLGMLVEQAAEAFAIWRGVRPATADLLTELRAELRQRA